MKGRADVSKTIIQALLKCTLVVGLLFLPGLLSAQTRGKVEVVKDPKVDSLMEDYLVVGSKGKSVTPSSSSSDGYRVQIFSGAERKGAYDAQAKFQDKYPDTRTYLSYREPNFKVRVGDFRTRLEAEKLIQELKPWFTGLFIVQEKISPPKLDTE